MLRRLLAATSKFCENNSLKNIKKVEIKSTDNSQILSAKPCSKRPKPANIFYDILNLESTNYTKASTIPIVRNMSGNAESEPLAPASLEQDLPFPPQTETDSLKGWSANEDDPETLDALQESYFAARQESDSKWLDYNKTCYIYLYRGGGEPSSVMAAFDLDGTIIKPKSNKRIPKSATDWQFFSVWTKVKIQQALKENQARFVIFTNQNGVGLKLVALEEVQERVELVTKRLNIPCTVFVAIDKDEFRKPNVGMYNLFRRSFNDSRSLDKERSFYCGDAVGYPSHSDADIKFAQTLRLPFLPPEKFLRGVKPKLVEESN